jgi:hypothetical protein
MKTDQPKTLVMEQAMLRNIIVGSAFGVALAFSAFVAVGPAGAQSGPLCTAFAEGAAGQDSWVACSGAPNIVISTSNVGSIGGASDYHLHLRDTSGASAACSTNQKYMGNWVEKMGGCGQFCFDFKVFVSGIPPGPITPSFSIYNGALRMVFVANFTVTSNDPWRQKICAPIKLLEPGEPLPSGSSGAWQAVAPATAADWNTVIQNVTMVQFPVDFTNSPSEEVGYDNLCMSPEPCAEKPPEITGCLKDMKAEVKCNPDGTYTVTLSGAGFTGNDITLTSQTPGVTVVPPQQPWSATTTWTLVGATAGQAVTLTANATQVGGGSQPGTDLCCSGEIKITMPDCPKPVDLTIGKENTGATGSGTWFNLWVTNLGAPIAFQPGELIVTDAIPAGMTVTSVTAFPFWICGPPPPPNLVGPATLTCKYNNAGTLGTNGSLPGSIVVHYNTTGPGPFTNCATISIAAAVGVDGVPSNDTACVTVTGTPVDVAIAKTGFTSPPLHVNHYGFTLTVTNMLAGFPGNGIITVTDVVPAGMQFTSITTTGGPWNCTPTVFPVAAGSTVTCIYTGSGPTAPNQVLGTISFNAQATVPAPYPPFTNCADVAITTGSGYPDTQLPNNHVCVTVKKPGTAAVLACDPRTTTKRGDDCVCRFPNMSKSSETACTCNEGFNFVAGRGCVARPECRDPFVLNAQANTCVCKPGFVQVGRECRQRPECVPPKIYNPRTNSCDCPRGTVAAGRECRPAIQCRPPAFPNQAGTECRCPPGMTLSGNTCVFRGGGQKGDGPKGGGQKGDGPKGGIGGGANPRGGEREQRGR